MLATIFGLVLCMLSLHIEVYLSLVHCFIYLSIYLKIKIGFVLCQNIAHGLDFFCSL